MNCSLDLVVDVFSMLIEKLPFEFNHCVWRMHFVCRKFNKRLKFWKFRIWAKQSHLLSNNRQYKMKMFNVTYWYGINALIWYVIYSRIYLWFFQLAKKNLEKFIGLSAFTDVTFELDDGKMKAHRAMLIARCDMMRAMLNGDFREAHAHTVCIWTDFYL